MADVPVFEFESSDHEYQRLNGAPVLARIYRPKGPGPFPAVIDVHGGGWTSGTRTMNAPIAEALAQRGVIVASLDFRNAPDGVYPAPVADINLGIRWFKANAEKFGTRPELVGGLGSSSGGHQLLCNALRPRDPRYAALPGPGVASLSHIVACWPVADPLARFNMAKERGVKTLLEAHAAYWPNEAAMAEGNPVKMLERGEATDLPPILILQGTADENLPADMGDRLATAWRKAGGVAEYEQYDGEPHAFVTKAPTSVNSLRALARIADFIRHHAAAVPMANAAK
jgi:acetyl esterase